MILYRSLHYIFFITDIIVFIAVIVTVIIIITTIIITIIIMIRATIAFRYLHSYYQCGYNGFFLKTIFI